MTDSDEWRPVPGAARYEASAGSPGCPGQVRSKAAKRVLAVGLSNRGRPIVTLTLDGGRRVPQVRAAVILSAWRGSRPTPKHDAGHIDDVPDHDWLGNLEWCTRAENEARKKENGNAAPPEPSHPCRNAPGCDGLVLHPGRRCSRCTREAGADIAARLGRRENLAVIADGYGFGVDWAWRLAREAGWEGSKGVALRQRPPLSRRVTARLTGWRSR